MREAGDLSAGAFDTKGRMLAQAVTGTPGHVNSMAIAVQHFLERYPNAVMREGDVYITNDPWLTCGHLHDLTVVTPVFREGRVIGSFACTAHVVDIGGRGFGPDARSVFEEGLYIPIMPLCREGRINEDLLEMVRWNVREPLQLEGDVHSLIACNRAGADRLLAMMDEFGLTDIDGPRRGNHRALAYSHARRHRRTAQGHLPQHAHHGRLRRADHAGRRHDHLGRRDPRRFHRHLAREQSRHQRGAQLHHRLHELRSQVHRGEGHPQQRGIARAAHRFGARRLDPQRAPALAGPPPATSIGHMLPDLVFGCLHQAIPERVPAEGAASLWIVQLRGGATAIDSEARRNATFDPPEFEVALFNSGGAGARPTKDGLSATAFPSGVRTIPAEATETVAPIVIWRKELAGDTGGAGLLRGGVGQVIEIGGTDGAPFSVLAQFERIQNPARGRGGGLDGAPGTIALDDGTKMRGKGQQTIPPGQRLKLVLPGGAGYGDPRHRAPEGRDRRRAERPGLARGRAAGLRRRRLAKRCPRRRRHVGASRGGLDCGRRIGTHRATLASAPAEIDGAPYWLYRFRCGEDHRGGLGDDGGFRCAQARPRECQRAEPRPLGRVLRDNLRLRGGRHRGRHRRGLRLQRQTAITTSAWWRSARPFHGRDGEVILEEGFEKPGLNHLGWEVDNEAALVSAIERAVAAGCQDYLTIDHTFSHSFYVPDADGVFHEFYADVMHDWRSVLQRRPDSQHLGPLGPGGGTAERRAQVAACAGLPACRRRAGPIRCARRGR